MNRSAQLRAFLWPTFLAVLVFAAFVGLGGKAWFGAGQSHADFATPGALTPDHLPGMGVDDLILPKPEMTPEEVVRTQLDGLSNPNADGVGILQCFAFASPANRSLTGPLDHFAEMVRQEPFACFARPHATLIGKATIDGSLARLLVTVMDDHNRVLAFTFILSRQTEKPFENCWMTESVYPMGGLAPAAPKTQSDPSPNAA